MILDIEFRTLTDGPAGPAKLQVRKLVKRSYVETYYVEGYPFDADRYHNVWTDWQDVPRIDRSELPEDER